MGRQNIAVTVDAVVFRKNSQAEVLLIKRKNPPFKNQWALPGGFVEEEENLETAAKRELKEETGLSYSVCEQLYTFGEPGRDPRGRTITVTYTGYVEDESTLKAADDASEVKWFAISNLPELAFDHEIIIDRAISHFLPGLP